ncbi:hypothetical protein [Bacillus dakarensis]|uniref:hypothetical protein n=1 Tax=Robertmurraya dakarensis TaxID=1926278 RepID=UPI000981C389|nr:hypothetical protein [Bacillus dakarensis]
MEYVIIGLLSSSILLIIFSFFTRDPYKELKDEFDQFSMQQIQELYQIKKKLKVLEEELLIEDDYFNPGTPVKEGSTPSKEIHAILKNQVWSLAQQGLSIEQISKQSSLRPDEVKNIINEFMYPKS